MVCADTRAQRTTTLSGVIGTAPPFLFEFFIP
jgi:hypothetical protein